MREAIPQIHKLLLNLVAVLALAIPPFLQVHIFPMVKYWKIIVIYVINGEIIDSIEMVGWGLGETGKEFVAGIVEQSKVLHRDVFVQHASAAKLYRS